MNDLELLDRLASTDLYESSVPLPEGWSIASTLQDLEDRLAGRDASASALQRAARSPSHPPFERLVAVRLRRRRGVVTAAATFILIVAAATVISLTLRSDRPDFVAPFEEDPITTEFAEDVADAMFTAMNAGDVDAAMSLMARDASYNFHGNDRSRQQAELDSTWDAAQGTTTSAHECTAEELQEDQAATVSCQVEWHDAVAGQLGAPPTPGVFTMTVARDGIISLEVATGEAPFGGIYAAFKSWMFVHHPEDLKVCETGYGTLAEARELGTLRAQYAQEWAVFLDERDCSYGTYCFLQTPATGGQ